MIESKSALVDFDDIEPTWRETTIEEFKKLPVFFNSYFINRKKDASSSSVIGIIKKVTKGTDYFAFICAIVNYQTDVQTVLIPMLDGLQTTISVDFEQFLDLSAEKVKEILQTFHWTFINSKGDPVSKQGWVHRFENIDRLSCVLAKMRSIKVSGGLKATAKRLFKGNFKQFLESFLETLRNPQTCGNCTSCKGDLCKKIFSDSKITAQSCLKRYLLFLRWMVRKDEIDLGLWSDIIDKKQLLVPLDLTIKRVCARVGVVESEDGCVWREVVKITKFFRELNPDDPISFDFPISRLGIMKFCVKEMASCKCFACPLTGVCKAKKNLGLDQFGGK